MPDFKAMVGWKDFRTLTQQLLERFKATGTRITNLSVGGVFRTLIELSAQGLADFYDLLAGDGDGKGLIRQGYVATATGGWLDLHAESFGLTRLEAVRAEGMVTFGRRAPGGNVVIPAGTLVKTPVSPTGRELLYTTTQDAVLPEGLLEVRVPVRAAAAGAEYNVGAGAITVLASAVEGIDYVTNAADWITRPGRDREDDESLRQRILLRWTSVARGGNRAAYLAWAKEVPGVGQVEVVPAARGAGTVDVLIMAESGLPSPELIAQVQAHIEELRAITADVLVKAPATVPVDITAHVLVHPERGDLAVVEASCRERLDGLFAANSVGVEPLRIGEDLARSRIIHVLMAVPDVIRVELTAPGADVAIAPGSIAVKGTVTLSVARATEL